MGLVLGLDGGGSKTLLALATEAGEVVCLEQTLGMDPAVGPLWCERLDALLRTAGAFDLSIEGAVFGLSSHGEIEAQDMIQRKTVARLTGPDSLVDNDVRIAFDGAFAGKGGVLLLAGTGSMAWASDGGPNARHVRVGGWGEAFGDEGSAFWIGREALSLSTRALDGRHRARDFAEALLAALDLRPQDIFSWASSLTDRRAGFAALARIVAGLAEAGDADARHLLETAADHLADHAHAARTAVGSSRPLAWSFAGGVFSSTMFLASVTKSIGTAPAPPRLPPVGGALLRAAERAGWPIGDAFIERLAGSLAQRLDPHSSFPNRNP